MLREECVSSFLHVNKTVWLAGSKFAGHARFASHSHREARTSRHGAYAVSSGELRVRLGGGHVWLGRSPPLLVLFPSGEETTFGRALHVRRRRRLGELLLGLPEVDLLRCENSPRVLDVLIVVRRPRRAASQQVAAGRGVLPGWQTVGQDRNSFHSVTGWTTG